MTAHPPGIRTDPPATPPRTDGDDRRAGIGDAAMAARRLLAAEAEATPGQPVRSLLGDDVDAAYRVQELVVSARESAANPRIGRKVGLTSTAVQRQLGVDQPDFGVLLRDMQIPDAGTLDLTRLIQPRIEAEIAFVLRASIHDATPDEVRDAVEHAVAALEIVDSRIADWDIGIVDTIADNASSARFVLGSTPVGLDRFTPRQARMSLTVNGETASTGDGSACLGDPLNALLWVAQTAIRIGRPLQAGEIVLSGALGPMVALNPGDRVRAVVAGLGDVSVRGQEG